MGRLLWSTKCEYCIVRNDKFLNRKQQMLLEVEMTREEVEMALKGMQDMKALGLRKPGQ